MGNKDSDQAGQMLRLSLVFAGRMVSFCFVMLKLKLSHFVSYFTNFRCEERIICG